MIDQQAPRFVAEYVLDGSGWSASVSEPPVCARGRSLASARIAMVAAIARHFDVVPSIVVLTDRVALGSDVDPLFADALQARDAAIAAAERSRLATEAAAVAARDAGVSLRDTAYLLGVSHSRIQQILDAAAASTDGKGHR